MQLPNMDNKKAQSQDVSEIEQIATGATLSAAVVSKGVYIYILYQHTLPASIVAKFLLYAFLIFFNYLMCKGRGLLFWGSGNGGQYRTPTPMKVSSCYYYTRMLLFHSITCVNNIFKYRLIQNVLSHKYLVVKIIQHLFLIMVKCIRLVMVNMEL
jgi:hypothetical protein